MSSIFDKNPTIIPEPTFDEYVNSVLASIQSPLNVEPVKPMFDNLIINNIEDEPLQVKTTENKRGATKYKYSTINVGGLRSFLDVLEDNGISVRVISGKRHYKDKKDTIDITPVYGETFESLYDQITSNDSVMKYIKDNNILLKENEDDKNTPHWKITIDNNKDDELFNI